MGTSISLPFSNSPNSPIVQVKTLNLTTQYAQNIPTLAWTDVSGMTLSITPTSISNKILVEIDWRGNASANGFKAGFAISRNGTLINTSGAALNFLSISIASYTLPGGFTSPRTIPEYSRITYIDSPNTTSALTYNLSFFTTDEEGIVVYTNRISSESSTPTYALISTIKLTEIA